MNSEKSVNHRDEDFLRRIQSTLNHEAPPLPPKVLRRLRSARLEALERRWDRGSLFATWPLFGHWRPLASGFSAAALVLSIAYFQLGRDSGGAHSEVTADAELLFGEEELQLYENLEFYSWLANNEL